MCRAASARAASSSSASRPPLRSTRPAASASPRPPSRSPASSPPPNPNPSPSPPPSPATAANRSTRRRGDAETRRFWLFRNRRSSAIENKPDPPRLRVRLLVLIEDGPAAAEGFVPEGAAGGGSDDGGDAGGGEEGEVAGEGIAAGDDEGAEAGGHLDLALGVGHRVEHLGGEVAVSDAHRDPGEVAEPGEGRRRAHDGQRARRHHHRAQSRLGACRAE